MKGSIRTRERCPVCREKFDHIERLGLFCPKHKTIPRTFYISIYFPGHGKFRRAVNSYRDGLDLLGKLNWEMKNHTFDPSRYVREQVERFYVCNLLDEFRAFKEKDLAPSYRGQYFLAIQRMKENLGTKDIREVNNLDLAGFKEGMGSGVLSPKTIKNHVDLLKTFIRWVRAYKGIDVRNATLWPRVEVPAPSFRFLTRLDQIKLYELVDPEDRPIIGFLMLHGCRPAEARALKIKDVDWPSRTITISATFSKGIYREHRKGRGTKPYQVPIHPESADFIGQRVRECLPGAWLFINPRNDRPYHESALRRLWDRVRKAAGLDKTLRLYDASRHSVATQLRASGISLSDIKDQLGHSDLRTTEKYAHGNMENLRANLGKLSLKKVVFIKEEKPNDSFGKS